MRRKGGASGRQLSGDFPLPYSGFRASLWQLSVPALWQLSRAAAFWRSLGEVSGSLSARASTRLPAPLIGRPTCFSHGKADRYGTKMARLTAMAVIEADFWSRQAKAKAKGLVAIFSPTRNACFRCHNGQPCHFGATAVGLADPEGHSGRPCRPGGTAVMRATHKEGDLQESGRCQARRACLPGERHQEGSQTPGRPLRAAESSQLATRPEGAGEATPGRHLGPTPAVTGPPGRHSLGQPPAVTGSHRPSWAATGERPPRRSPPAPPSPLPLVVACGHRRCRHLDVFHEVDAVLAGSGRPACGRCCGCAPSPC